MRALEFNKSVQVGISDSGEERHGVFYHYYDNVGSVVQDEHTVSIIYRGKQRCGNKSYDTVQVSTFFTKKADSEHYVCSLTIQ